MRTPVNPSDTLEAQDYQIDLDTDEKAMRLVFLGPEDNVLSYMILSSADCYDLGARILKGYDLLEGIV